MQSFRFKFPDDLMLYTVLRTEWLNTWKVFFLLVCFYEGPKSRGRQGWDRKIKRAKILHQPEPHRKTPFQKGRAIDVCLNKHFISSVLNFLYHLCCGPAELSCLMIILKCVRRLTMAESYNEVFFVVGDGGFENQSLCLLWGNLMPRTVIFFNFLIY